MPDRDTMQLELPGLTLTLEPTPSMLKNEQSVFQCAQCGTVVVQSRPASHRLAVCPCCLHPAASWWRQELPLAGLGPVVEAGGD